MNTIPVDTIFGLYTLANGMVPISAHPVTADRLTTLVCAGVPYSQPPVLTLWQQEAEANRYIPVDLEPGQIGWEVRASCIALDNARSDDDGPLTTEPVLEVALLDDDGVTILSRHSVTLPVPSLPYGDVDIQATPGVCQVVTGGTSRSADPASREGLLWVEAAARSVRHCLLVVLGGNVGVQWLQLIPVWDHATAIADMGT
jgi:hypothetical protein